MLPVNLVLHCPNCGFQHIDKPVYEIRGGELCIDWDNRPHKSHLCSECGHIWRPADVFTNGIEAVRTKGESDSQIVERNSKEAWRNGWSRDRYTVLVGVMVHCAGCGDEHGITCVAFPQDWEPPGPDPVWPFEKDTCPICELRNRPLLGYSSSEDKLLTRMLALQARREKKCAAG